LHVTQGDLEKEKRKLQNIFAHGTESICSLILGVRPRSVFPAVLNEIQERQQFLEDMASLGQEKDYIDIINTEISQVNVLSATIMFI
uniref:Uncharacterized protein n=1 Tax=Pundamilia nyererei TaxID=303518 RepID=A0A3B4FCH4_9CICH